MLYTAPLRTKRLLRGVSHEVAGFVAFPAAVLLARSAAPGQPRVAPAVYGATLVTLFAVSAIYHRVTWSPPARAVMRRVDHAAIFLLIAGTYTPFGLVLGGTRGGAMLAAIWAGAGLGIVQSIFWNSAPKVLVAGLCVGLGWMVVVVARPLGATVGTVGLALLVVGGLLYSAGAAVYAVRRPDPGSRDLRVPRDLSRARHRGRRLSLHSRRSRRDGAALIRAFRCRGVALLLTRLLVPP